MRVVKRRVAAILLAATTTTRVSPLWAKNGRVTFAGSRTVANPVGRRSGCGETITTRRIWAMTVGGTPAAAHSPVSRRSAR